MPSRRPRLSALAVLTVLALCAGPGVPGIRAADELPHQPVSRLPPLPQPLDPIMQQMFDQRRKMGGAVINLQLVTGHAPKFSRAAAAMAFTIRFDAMTPRRLLELVIMRTAGIVRSDYELNQHRPLMKLCGYSEAQIAAIGSWRESTLFDDK